MNDVWIAGAGMTRFGRRDESLPDLMAEAALAALGDAAIERPDAIVVAAMNPEEFTGEGNYGSLINTRLAQRGLDQPPLELRDGAVKAGGRPGLGIGKDHERCHGREERQARCHAAERGNSTG